MLFISMRWKSMIEIIDDEIIAQIKYFLFILFVIITIVVNQGASKQTIFFFVVSIFIYTELISIDYQLKRGGFR